MTKEFVQLGLGFDVEETTPRSFSVKNDLTNELYLLLNLHRYVRVMLFVLAKIDTIRRALS